MSAPLTLARRDPVLALARPVLKWAGGKTQLLAEIHRRLPAGILDGSSRYIEPFVGGGAVFFSLRAMGLCEDSVLIDINADLINLYRTIQSEPESLVTKLSAIEREYLTLDQDQRAGYFSKVRERFNARDSRIGVDAARDMVFLNRTCFNGLYRLNSSGKFNVPHGRYVNPRIANPDGIRAASVALTGVELVHGDYRQSERFFRTGTFMYVDPPYRPLSATSSFVSYSRDGFNDDDQVDLANFLAHSEKVHGIKFMLSNSDPSDSFFDDLYSDFNVERVSAVRNINSKAAGRGAISEILVTNY